LSILPTVVPVPGFVNLLMISKKKIQTIPLFQISGDGRSRIELKRGECVKIGASPWPIATICHTDPSRDLFQSLARCLNWNVREPQKPFSYSTKVPQFPASSASPILSTGSNVQSPTISTPNHIRHPLGSYPDHDHEQRRLRDTQNYRIIIRHIKVMRKLGQSFRRRVRMRMRR